jgi:hypothetical protein
MEWDRSTQEIRAADPRFKRSVPQCNQLRKGSLKLAEAGLFPSTLCRSLNTPKYAGRTAKCRSEDATGKSKQISSSNHDLNSSQYREVKGADTNALHVIRYLECHSMMPCRNISVIGQ